MENLSADMDIQCVTQDFSLSDFLETWWSDCNHPWFLRLLLESLLEDIDLREI